MQRTIPESDWKIPRRVHLLAVEGFSERVLAEIEDAVHRGQSAHQRYLDIFEIVQQRNREMALMFDDPKRSRALTMLTQIRAEGLLTEEEFASLSAETRSAVTEMLRNRG